FIYQKALVKNKAGVSIHVQDATLAAVMQEVTSDLDLTYRIMDDVKTVIVQAKPAAADKTTETAVVQQSVTGTVTDENGEPLAGISVTVAGTTSGTSTNEQGRFTIAAQSTDVLVISGVGYAAQRVTVGNQSLLGITLQAEIDDLEEVVVVGYATQKKKDLTGAVTSVSLENSPKADVPLVNPLEALQGTAGINVGPSSSAGATPTIMVRGQNSITANTSPLIVLDGVIFNGDLSEINMNDVATYDILRDASSAAIYGSRSANGVVIITTKRGKSDKPVININSYYGVQQWTRVPKMMGPAKFVDWRKNNQALIGLDTSDINVVFSPDELRAFNSGHTMDWLEDIKQYAPIQNYEANISGRTSNLNYYFSAGFLDQKGV